MTGARRWRWPPISRPRHASSGATRRRGAARGPALPAPTSTPRPRSTATPTTASGSRRSTPPRTSPTPAPTGAARAAAVRPRRDPRRRDRHRVGRARSGTADPDAGAAQRAASLADLAGGVTSLWLVVGDGGCRSADLARALDGVYLDLAPVVLDAGADAAAAADALLALAAAAASRAAELRGSLGADPIGVRAAHRRRGRPDPAGRAGRPRRATRPGCGIATVDATATTTPAPTTPRARHRDGGRGRLPAGADRRRPGRWTTRCAAMEFRFAVTDDQFASIAKLRAARRHLGPRGRAVRRRPERRRPAPARRHVGGDDAPTATRG